MTLKLEKEVEDIRGKIFFFSQNKKWINLVEIKKGFSRGGHYHQFDSLHFIIAGKVEYLEEDLDANNEKRIVIDSPTMVITPLKKAHLLTAIEDSTFFEIFDEPYNAITYPKYRNIVEARMRDKQ